MSANVRNTSRLNRSGTISTPTTSKTVRNPVAGAVAASPASAIDADVNGLADANISDDEEGGTRVGGIYIPPPVQPHCSMESKGPRLIIKNIEINNFKSYAGKVDLGPFHHCFTSIIGPNGSGKSNVIDAMLFVFGYRVNKIRCKKLSTLLHKSASFPDCASCSVAVHFIQIEDQPGGECTKVPNSDIIVERSAFRDNTSYYTINGRRVQFKEVSKLLKQHKIDLDHNRFLILQGEVESIAMMKAKGQNENECGMLEYLEDIIGTSRYKVPLVQINDRVQQLTEERSSRHVRCKLAEREIDDLEKPYTDAIEFLRLENENTRTKNLRIQKYLCEKNQKLEEYTKEHDEASNTLKEHDHATQTLREQLLEKEKLAQQEIAEFENMKKNMEKLKSKLESATAKYTETQSTMTVTNTRRKKNKSQLEKNEEALKELLKVPEKNKGEIEECKKKIVDLNKEKSQLDNELQENYKSLESVTNPLIEKREKFATELVDLRKNVDEVNSALSIAESELKIIKSDETREMRKYNTFKSSLEETENSTREKRERYEELKKSLPTMDEEVRTKTKQLQNLQKDEEQLKFKLTQIKSEINERRSNIQNSHFTNKTVNFLMRLKAEGKLPGILGRLGDLGGIDAKYDVAISTCCGRLDNILVDTVSTAQACIEQLKRYDIGRATFLALDQISHWRNKMGSINTPENVPRLFDLIRVEDQRILPAFYYALHDTLVAVDLDQGTRIAYGKQRYRVVTLDGAIIELAGTMSGGGKTQIRGKMGTKVQVSTKQSANDSTTSQKDLDDMEEQAGQLQSKINYYQEQQGILEHDIMALNNNKRRNESEMQTVFTKLNYLDAQLPRLSKQVEEQKLLMEKTKSDAAQVKKMEKLIEDKKAELEICESKANVVSDKINEIKAQIDKIHDEKVKSIETKITKVSNQIKNVNNNVLKLTVEITTSERNVAKMERTIENLKSDIIKAQNEITELSTLRQKYDDETTQLSQEIEEAAKNIETVKNQTSGIHAEIIALQKQEGEHKMQRLEIEQKVQTIAAKLNEVKSQIPRWRDQLRPLKLNEIPGSSEPEPPLKQYTQEELAAHTLQDIQYKESVQEELLKKKPNLSVIDEYTAKRNAFCEQAKELEDITLKRNEMRHLYDEIRKKRYNEFTQSFNVITRQLKEMYQMITQGGDAELELVDSMDPFTEGVSFSVRPPKKTWKNISNLSGGEKTLSSLALVFALHYYKPSPLYFMDEIDAALDFKNISIVASYIKDRTKNAQFIIISLRSNMFELSDFLCGIYKVWDCTRAIALKNQLPDHLISSFVGQQSKNNSCNASNETIIDASQSGNDLISDTPNANSPGAERQNGTNTSGTFDPRAESTNVLTQITHNSSDADSVFKKPYTPEPRQTNQDDMTLTTDEQPNVIPDE